MLLRSGRRVAAGKKEVRATVPRKIRRAGADRFAAIPEEMLQEVLVRLPARSVLRCRAVCHSWRRLASDPAFLLEHHRRQPELPLVSFSRTARLEAVQVRAAEFRRVFLSPKLPIRVNASCDGMLIMGRNICNPATRQSRPFSRNPSTLRFCRVVALFRHEPSGEYRVLLWRHAPYEYFVLTVGSDNVRQIKYLLGEMRPWIIGAPVLLHGSLHMQWKPDPKHWITVFDTIAESFRHMRPPALVHPESWRSKLFGMGGTLAMSATSKDDMSEMNIFMLQDRQHEVWAFHYQIKLPVMDIRRFKQNGRWCAKVVSEEGDLLVSCRGHLLHCDKKGNLVANYPYDDELPVVSSHRFKESLIQPTFFQKENKSPNASLYTEEDKMTICVGADQLMKAASEFAGARASASAATTDEEAGGVSGSLMLTAGG